MENSTKEKQKESCTLRLLGQEIPTNRYTCIAFVSVVVAYTVVSLRSGNPAQFTSQIVAAFYGKGGVVEQEFRASSYRFWTPATDTLEKMKEVGTFVPPEKIAWYKLEEGEETLKKFAGALRSKGVQGYMRTYGWGEGTEGLKPGWNWSITVPPSASFTIKDLVELYRNYFHRDAQIYIETYRLGETRFSTSQGQ